MRFFIGCTTRGRHRLPTHAIICHWNNLIAIESKHGRLVCLAWEFILSRTSFLCYCQGISPSGQTVFLKCTFVWTNIVPLILMELYSFLV